ncbi:tail fiber domain-containing protein [Citrobacter sp. UYEF32]|uniref:tail fiber domain-containing protein n=1 Tax=Citrobacter sp. UYEF32 TaxID=3156347 RepID=UPI00339AA9B7
MNYTTGTIAIVGNTLTGTGTNFTAAGSLIRVGCTLISLSASPQVFQITAINSATQLTVTPAANPAIAAGTAYVILLSDSLSVDGLAQNIAETLTLYQKNMSGFADVMNGAGDVTITTNGAAITVPGQKSLAKKGANSDITSLSGLTTPLSQSQGGTGLANPFGTTPGSFCQGNDSRLNTINGKTGGYLTGNINSTVGSTSTDTALSAPAFVSGYSGYLTPHWSSFNHRYDPAWGSYSYITVNGGTQINYFRFLADGRMVVPNIISAGNAAYYTDGNISGAQWAHSGSSDLKTFLGKNYAPLSDRRIKRNIQPITREVAIAEVKSWATYTYEFTYGKLSSGVIADEVNERFISVVPGEFEGVEDVKTVDQTGMLMGFVPPVLQYLLEHVEKLTARIAAMEPKKSEEPAAE